MCPAPGPCRSGYLPARGCRAPSVPEGPRGRPDTILEPSSLASKAWWAYLYREETDPLMGWDFFLRALFPFPQFHLASIFFQSNAPNEISWRALDGAESWFEDVYTPCRTRLMVFSSAQLILQSSEMCQIQPLARRVTGLCRHTFNRKPACLFSFVNYLIHQHQGQCVSRDLWVKFSNSF